jgi:hypothetical protein
MSLSPALADHLAAAKGWASVPPIVIGSSLWLLTPFAQPGEELLYVGRPCMHGVVGRQDLGVGRVEGCDRLGVAFVESGIRGAVSRGHVGLHVSRGGRRPSDGPERQERC